MLTLFLMNYKGFSTLKALHAQYPHLIEKVVSSADSDVEKDYYEDIKQYCLNNDIEFFNKKQSVEFQNYAIAIGWKWLIKNMHKLIVFHDSLLPRYRGFNPLVTALINGDNDIGVTALFAADKADAGDIIAQETIRINYPIKINEAIELIAPLYEKLALYIAKQINEGKTIMAKSQNHLHATYSLWRDEQDYFIDWNKTAREIKRHIDASGYPYLGACSKLNGEVVRILDVEIVDNLFIANRVAGKIFAIEDGCPIVICGYGLLKILHMKDLLDNNKVVKKLKSRFL